MKRLVEVVLLALVLVWGMINTTYALNDVYFTDGNIIVRIGPDVKEEVHKTFTQYGWQKAASTENYDVMLTRFGHERWHNTGEEGVRFSPVLHSITGADGPLKEAIAKSTDTLGQKMNVRDHFMPYSFRGYQNRLVDSAGFLSALIQYDRLRKAKPMMVFNIVKIETPFSQFIECSIDRPDDIKALLKNWDIKDRLLQVNVFDKDEKLFTGSNFFSTDGKFFVTRWFTDKERIKEFKEKFPLTIITSNGRKFEVAPTVASATPRAEDVERRR